MPLYNPSAGLPSDTAYNATSWDGVTTVAPSKNAVRDQIEVMIAAYTALISDSAYNAGTWDAVTGVAASKNAVRDQIEAMIAAYTALVSDTAYDTTFWNGVTTIAPSKNAVRDILEALGARVYGQAQSVNAQTGTTYTLVAGDAGLLVTLSNGSAITLTLPQDSDATIAVGTYVDLYQLGAGQVTVAAGTGATLRVSGLTAKARAQYSRLGVQKVLTNTWSLFGDLAAS